MKRRHSELVRSEWVIALAVLVLVPSVIGLWWVDRENSAKIRDVQAVQAWAAYDASLGACERGNVLRRAANDQATALRSVSFIVSAFLDSSVDLRLDAGRPGLAEQAGMARDAIARIAANLGTIPEVDCEHSIQKPVVPRPEATERKGT